MQSSIRDDFGSRRFNGQSKYVYNFGMIQNFPKIGGTIGATYRKQGPAVDRIIGEEIRTTYGADLEVFIEKRFGKSFTLRAVGSNLLNGAKDEVFNKFTTIGDQRSRSFDEYELAGRCSRLWHGTRSDAALANAAPSRIGRGGAAARSLCRARHGGGHSAG